MKHILFTLALASVAGMANAQQNGHSYTVEGLINDSTLNGQTLYISRYDDGMKVDSTQVANGQFKFTGKADTPYFCRIDAGREYANFILEGGNIQVNVLTHNDPKGTPMNEEYSRIHDRTSEMVATLKSKHSEIEQQTKDKAEQLRLKKEYSQTYWHAAYTQLYKELFMNNPDNALGEYAIRSLIMSASPEEMEPIFATAGPWLKSLQTYKRIEKQCQAMKATAIGQKFTDFSGKAVDGSEVSLSDYVGKGTYTLVDFWASWCGPCRAESPHVAQLYNEYKDKGLTVLGVAVWDKPEHTKKAIKELNINWPQIIDTGMTPMDLYGVNGIPFIILFGPDGTIIARDLRGEAMIKKVTEVLNIK
ncbi:TlpA disulfide reductase family protein [Bacteroides fragilis]|uniref:redoxin domain-containing protein n=1 Tax=Bacteroides fragilis TaxID=817 RepID=UPI001C7D7A16|nr:TlpA disulfide reductase family protein [Bacteroides fragilis]